MGELWPNIIDLSDRDRSWTTVDSKADVDMTVVAIVSGKLYNPAETWVEVT